MATLDRNLNVWRSADGQTFASQAEAEAYEKTGQRTQVNDTDSFGDVYDALAAPKVRPTDAALADAQQYAPIDNTGRTRAAAMASGRLTGATPNNYGLSLSPSTAAEAAADQQTAHDAMVKRTGGLLGDAGRLTAYAGGALANPAGFIAGDYLGKPAQAAINPAGFFAQQGLEQAAGLLPGGSGTGVGSSNPPQNGGAGLSAGSDAIRTPSRPNGGTAVTGGAGGTPEQRVADDQAGRDADRTTLTDLWDEARYNGSEDAKQSRDQQQQALSKQAQLYDMLSKFDPDAYAEKASDLALKNQLAIARSVNGAAGSADALGQAIESGPTMQTEARRDADAQLLQKQQLAAQVTGQMGDLASQTRGQDVGEAQLKSEFGARIADGLGAQMGLDWQLDSKESATLANVALALDQQNIDWARLDLDAQVAEANRILSEAGLDQAWRIFKSGQGVSEAQLYGGLMTLLGSGLEGYMGIQAAKAMK